MIGGRTPAAPVAAHAPQLLAELKLADRIISAMLNALTIQQKSKIHAQLEAAGVTGAGMTRANERLAVIEVAGVLHQVNATAPAHTVDVAGIRQQAHDIESEASDIEILLKVVFEKLDSLSDLPPAVADATNAINCMATCALRYAALIKRANSNILALAMEGGAA
jgi:hypothetical protein